MRDRIMTQAILIVRVLTVISITSLLISIYLNRYANIFSIFCLSHLILTINYYIHMLSDRNRLISALIKGLLTNSSATFWLQYQGSIYPFNHILYEMNRYIFILSCPTTPRKLTITNLQFLLKFTNCWS